jgi:hypothetical protein
MKSVYLGHGERGGERTNVVNYGDVRISDRYRLDKVNDGGAMLHGLFGFDPAVVSTLTPAPVQQS